MELAIPEIDPGKEKTAFSERQSKLELQKYGVEVPSEYVVADKAELDTLKLQYPVVAKIESPDILHKSDVGGVKLNLQNLEDLKEAFDEVMENAKRHCPEARINGVLVNRMLPKGMEFIIGVNNDPQFGPMVLCGLGGVFVEVFKDVSLYPAPLNKAEAMEMIRSLKGYKLLTGYRGQKEGDVEALARMIVQVADYAAQNKDTLAELDINPVFVYPRGEGVVMADALVVKRQ